MAKNMKARFKESRRLGLNIYGHPKAMNRYKVGDSREDRKLSNYGKQLLEKQRLKAYYGVLEKQFSNYVSDAMKSHEITGNALVCRLEQRLDNLVYRSGFGRSIRQARQMVVHGHLLVNGKKVDRPSFKVNPGDTLSLRSKSTAIQHFIQHFEEERSHGLPYIEKNSQTYEATLIRIPYREEIPIQINDALVVEFYSK